MMRMFFTMKLSSHAEFHQHIMHHSRLHVKRCDEVCFDDDDEYDDSDWIA